MQKKLVDAIGTLVVLVSMVLVLAFGIWGAAILFLQGVIWFKSGNWTPIPAKAAFYYTPGDYPAALDKALPNFIGESDFSHWLQSPASALGPHHIIMYFLENTGIWFFFVLTAIAVLIGWALIHAKLIEWSELLASQNGK